MCCTVLHSLPQHYTATVGIKSFHLTKLASHAATSSGVQVLIRWSLQHGFVPLPKSVNAQRQASNADVFDWQLGDADMAALDGLEQDLVTGWDPIRDHKV
jgi:diketogulonate reductase-like aldo/keto reductase